jgi:ankyrin repeat protein
MSISDDNSNSIGYSNYSSNKSYFSIVNGSVGSSGSFGDPSPKLPDLYVSVENKQWHKVKTLIHSPNALKETGLIDSTGLTFLGLCVAFSAPEEILRRVLELHPQHIFTQDVYDATVLHIACLNAASLETVTFLINACKDLVNVPDIDGRLPIHHAVECICRDQISLETSIAVMTANIDIDPNILTSVDNNGCTVIDIIHEARCRETNTTTENERLWKAYSFLKQCSINNWMIKKKIWEEMGSNEKDQKTQTTYSSSSYYSISHLSAPESDASRFNVSMNDW